MGRVLGRVLGPGLAAQKARFLSGAALCNSATTMVCDLLRLGDFQIISYPTR